ncbi:MAG: hypothetical protein JW940_00075 [Polyangiaceae bacterium]|nr:hypothetical protein [Polyangiaceae bacterium]
MPFSTVTEPASDADLVALVDRCGDLKRLLVEYACQHFADEIRRRLARRAKAARTAAASPVPTVVDELIHENDPESGDSVLECFVRDSPGLSADDRRVVLGWRESVVGVFELGECAGSTIRARNLVDDLDYVLMATTDDPSVLARLAR